LSNYFLILFQSQQGPTISSKYKDKLIDFW